MADYKLQQLRKRCGPVVCLILDGYGIGPDSETTNAVFAAHPAFLNQSQEEAKKNNLWTHLHAHGHWVGLPSDSDMGNSEVGHNALGCGQIFAQGSKLVAESLNSGAIFETDSYKQKVGAVVSSGRTVHLFGLLSDGGVHSHIDHLFILLDGLARSGVKRIVVHPLLDGRDVAPDSGLIYLEKLENKLAQLRAAGTEAIVGSVAGRMHSVMDRYNSDWPVVRRGYRQIVYGYVEPEEITEEYPGYFRSAMEAVKTARRVYPQKLDQYNPVAVIVDEQGKPVGSMVDGDLVINWNYRGDRAIQISNSFDQDDTQFTAFDRHDPRTGAMPPKVAYCGMLEYDTEYHIPRSSLVPPPSISNVLSQYTCANGITAYAIAESHKYGHVTFFWNGNAAGYIDPKLERYVEVKSEPSDMIEGHPEMRHVEVTDALVAAIRSGEYKFLRCNFAGPDMVGHTGNFNSVERVVKCVSECAQRVVEAVREMHGVILITADHGNAEIMRNEKGAPVTSHTCSPVACWISEFDDEWKGKYTMKKDGDAEPQGLSNIAATMLTLLGYSYPDFYHPALIQFN